MTTKACLILIAAATILSLGVVAAAVWAHNTFLALADLALHITTGGL